MEPSSVRLIPNVFDKLLYYVAPADAVVCGNASWMLGPISCRQVRARLATPKKQMLLLAWPFCMHVREDVSNYNKEAEFYDILRTNVVNRSDDTVNSEEDNTADEEMSEFLTGFELLMLEFVESSINLYSNLKVLMLDFHDNPNDQKIFGNLIYSRVLQWAPYQYKASERWGKVIGAVVARCAPELRHFLFVVGTCSELPDKFYTSLKLDCLLAQMQHLETLYIPSIEAYNVAHTKLRARRLCWQALHDLPIEQRLPKLRRIVLGYSSKISRTNSDWEDKMRVLALDAVAIHAAFRSDRVVENARQTRSGKVKLPQFHHCLTASSKQQQLLVIEVMGEPGPTAYYDDIERSFGRVLRNDTSSETHILCYLRDENKLTLSRNALVEILIDNSFHDAKFQPHSRNFIDAVENSLSKISKDRSQMLSIVNDVRVDGLHTTAKIPACIDAVYPSLMEPKSAALLLCTLSCRLSSPLSLTIQLNWNTLLKNMALFTTNKGNATLLNWSRCISRRGELKLELKISNSLQTYVDDSCRRCNNSNEKRAQFDKMCRNNLSSSVENRYMFPPQVTIVIRAPRLVLEYTPSEIDDADYMPFTIREHFRTFLQKFVDDSVVTGDESIDNTDKIVRTLSADLCASCRKLVVHVEICSKLPLSTESNKQANTSRHLQRVKKLVYGKQFEAELVQLFFNNANDGATNDKKEPQLIMPNLQSVSIMRDVT